MSEAKFTTQANVLLDPVIHQVIGSTPQGLVEAVKKSGIKNSPDAATQVAILALFAASVNKQTLETYASGTQFVKARQAIGDAFSIGGKINMTVMTLMGHCLLTTSAVDAIKYVVELRKKMGQANVWAGPLTSGSMSDMQKKIYMERAEKTSLEEAKLFGTGFWKFVGITREPMNTAEANFWGQTAQVEQSEPSARNVSGNAEDYDEPITPPTRFVERQHERQAQGGAPGTGDYSIRLPGGGHAVVDKIPYDYYLAINNGDKNKLAKSVEAKGVNKWNEQYTRAAAMDPNRQGLSGGTVIG